MAAKSYEEALAFAQKHRLATFHFDKMEYVHVGEDESGVWLYRPTGSWV